MKPKKHFDKRTIGRRERIDLPELNLQHIPAKVDTGAYSCSIHAEEIKISLENGQEFLDVMLIGANWEGFRGQWQRFEKWKQKKVKNSFGNAELRYMFRTTIRLFGQDYQTDFTLSNRERMTYPILLGRKFLKNRFIVDVSEVDLVKNKPE